MKAVKTFKLIGAKPARIKSRSKDYVYDAKTFRDVLNSMGVKAEIRVKEEDDVLKINLVGQIWNNNRVQRRNFRLTSISC